MTRFSAVALALLAGLLLVVPAMTQSAEDDNRRERKDGPPRGERPRPRYQLGQLLPPHAREGLKLTAKQEEELSKLEKEVKTRLEKILTPDQKKQLETLMRQPPPRPPQDRPPPRRENKDKE